MHINKAYEIRFLSDEDILRLDEELRKRRHRLHLAGEVEEPSRIRLIKFLLVNARGEGYLKNLERTR